MVVERKTYRLKKNSSCMVICCNYQGLFRQCLDNTTCRYGSLLPMFQDTTSSFIAPLKMWRGLQAKRDEAYQLLTDASCCSTLHTAHNVLSSVCLRLCLSVCVYSGYIMHHYNGIWGTCAPAGRNMHHQGTICTMVQKGDYIF